jgi:DNA-binding transcriptional MerR regulator
VPELTIGELARRTGVATSALRYWEALGVLPAPVRVSGRRRYPEAALAQVGLILLLRDAGYTLAEQKALIEARGVAPDEWRRLHRLKLAELDEQIAKAQLAREAVSHGLRCPHEDPFDCPNFGRLTAARLAGRSLQEAHAELHRYDAVAGRGRRAGSVARAARSATQPGSPGATARSSAATTTGS